MASILLNIYQVILFGIFIIIFMIYVLPHIINYISETTTKNVSHFMSLLHKRDHVKRNVHEISQKQSKISIDISFTEANENKKLSALQNGLHKDYDNKIMQHAIQNSKLIRQKYINKIIDKLEQKMSNNLINERGNIMPAFESCINKIRNNNDHQ